MGISSGNSCHCKADKADKSVTKGEKTGGTPLLNPLKGKMKVLKKIKRKMGLGQYFLLLLA